MAKAPYYQVVVTRDGHVRSPDTFDVDDNGKHILPAGVKNLRGDLSIPDGYTVGPWEPIANSNDASCRITWRRLCTPKPAKKPRRTRKPKPDPKDEKPAETPPADASE